MSDIRLNLTSPETVKLFRAVAEAVLEAEGLTPGKISEFLSEKAVVLGVHSSDCEAIVQAVLDNPTIQSAMEKAEQQKRDQATVAILQKQNDKIAAQLRAARDDARRLQSSHTTAVSKLGTEHMRELARLQTEQNEEMAKLQERINAAEQERINAVERERIMERRWTEETRQVRLDRVRRRRGELKILWFGLIFLSVLIIGSPVFWQIYKGRLKQSTGLPAERPSLVGSFLIVSPDGDGDCITISQAIQRAMTGTRILVRPGVYTEFLTLDKNVEVIGDGPQDKIVVNTTDNSCVYMNATGGEARIRGLTMKCSNTNLMPKGQCYSTVKVASGSLKLEDCDISSQGGFSVSVHGDASDATMIGCRIHDSTYAGVRLTRGGEARMTNCTIYKNKGEGIDVIDDGQATLSECCIYQNLKSGMYSETHGHLFADNCYVYANQYCGIRIDNEGEGTITRCSITSNKECGVVLESVLTAMVRDNQITSNGLYGFMATGRTLATLSDNFLGGNKAGPIYISTDAIVGQSGNSK